MDTGLDVAKINKTAAPVPEQSEEEERQVRALYEALWPMFEGVDHIVVAKCIGVFMVTLMHISKQWEKVIPGFMNQMDMGANLALTHHQAKDENNGNEETQGDDRGVEVKEG